MSNRRAVIVRLDTPVEGAVAPVEGGSGRPQTNFFFPAVDDIVHDGVWVTLVCGPNLEKFPEIHVIWLTDREQTPEEAAAPAPWEVKAVPPAAGRSPLPSEVGLHLLAGSEEEDA
jgi:hypothetical protein